MTSTVIVRLRTAAPPRERNQRASLARQPSARPLPRQRRRLPSRVSTMLLRDATTMKYRRITFSRHSDGVCTGEHMPKTTGQRAGVIAPAGDRTKQTPPLVVGGVCAFWPKGRRCIASRHAEIPLGAGDAITAGLRHLRDRSPDRASGRVAQRRRMALSLGSRRLAPVRRVDVGLGWAYEESNLGPHPCHGCALTN
jgi:hypothetical protein